MALNLSLPCIALLRSRRPVDRISLTCSQVYGLGFRAVNHTHETLP
jgi:hypothetical protein